MTTMRLIWALVLMGLPGAAPLLAQQPVDKAMTYDAASVKPNKTGSGHVGIDTGDNTFQGENVPLKVLIQRAYGLLSRDQVTDLPAWANDASYDVLAKLSAEDVAKMKKESREDQNLQEQVLMQALLADRFQLKVHHESREMALFTLVIAKGGVKFPVSDASNPKAGNFSVHNEELTATGVPMSSLAMHLSPRVHKIVLDKTGMTGSYDFEMKWRRDDLVPGQDGSAAEALPTLFDALPQQLGLKLESAKGPVDTVVVDHIAMPSED